MKRLVRRSKTQLPVREQALAITANVPNKDYAGEARAIFYWVKSNIRYVQDVNGVETLHWPEKILKQKAGDCDDQATLVAALLESIGHKTRFVAIGRRKGQFEHVAAETKIGNSWFWMETTEAGYQFGQAPPGSWYTMTVYN